MFTTEKKSTPKPVEIPEFNEIDVCISTVEDNIVTEKDTDGEIVYRAILKRDLEQGELSLMDYKLKDYYLFAIVSTTQHLVDEGHSVSMGTLLDVFIDEKQDIQFNRTTLAPMDLDNALQDCSEIKGYIYSVGTIYNGIEEIKENAHPSDDIKLSFNDPNEQPRDVYISRDDDMEFHQSHLNQMNDEQFEIYLKRGIANIKHDDTKEVPVAPIEELKKTVSVPVIVHEEVETITEENIDELLNDPERLLPIVKNWAAEKVTITNLSKEEMTSESMNSMAGVGSLLSKISGKPINFNFLGSIDSPKAPDTPIVEIEPNVIVIPKEDVSECPKKAIKIKTVDKTPKAKKKSKKAKTKINWDRSKIMKRAARFAKAMMMTTHASYKECIGEAIRKSWTMEKEYYAKKTGKVAPKPRGRKYKDYDRKVIANAAWDLAKKSVKQGVVTDEDIRSAYKVVLNPYLLDVKEATKQAAKL